MVMRNRLAVIPARGGSKRIPRKNLVDFYGKPLVAWSIEAALSSGLFERVFVSTDDPEIAAVAAHHGGEVPFLRDRHCDDDSTVSDVTIHTLLQLETKLQETYASVVTLQATCPLRDASDIRNAVGGL